MLNNAQIRKLIWAFSCTKKPTGSAGGSKSFSYAQNKLSKRSEEQLLESKDRKSIELRKSRKEKPYR